MCEQIADELAKASADAIRAVIRIADKYGMDRDETLRKSADVLGRAVRNFTYKKT